MRKIGIQEYKINKTNQRVRKRKKRETRKEKGKEILKEEATKSDTRPREDRRDKRQ